MICSFKGLLWKAYPPKSHPLLRGHRPFSIALSKDELVELRYPHFIKRPNVSARQRTYEAAYWRTALGQFSFALIIMSIFQSEFYGMGSKSV
jgi:hypothetical protein